jgi:hypothetical protein
MKAFKTFLRRKASPSIDKSGAKPPIFSQRQHIKSKFSLVLTLILIENAGFALRRDKQVSPAFIYEAEGFVLKRFFYLSLFLTYKKKDILYYEYNNEIPFNRRRRCRFRRDSMLVDNVNST